VAQYFKDTSDTHLECRDFKHAWKWESDFTPVKDPDSKKIVSMWRILKCIRCGTKRYDEYGLPSMERIKSVYYYADGYQIVGSIGHIPVSDVRKEILSRYKRYKREK